MNETIIFTNVKQFIIINFTLDSNYDSCPKGRNSQLAPGL